MTHMNYADIFSAANDKIFQGRCRVATWHAAQDIASESEEAASHQVRIDWAMRVLTDTTNITDRQLAMQVLRNPVIADSPTAAADADIQYQVNAVLADIIRVG